MFCKYCGETIDRSSMKCSKCGRDAEILEGGIGFWDLAEKPSQPAEPRNVQPDKSTPTPKPATAAPKRKKPSHSAVTLLLIGSIALNIAALTTSLGTKSAQEELNAKVDYLSSTLLQLQQSVPTDYATGDDIEEITATVDKLEQLHHPTLTVTQKPQTITIPASAQLPEDELLYLFSVRAKGSDLTVRWQYAQNYNGTFIQWRDLDSEDAPYLVESETLADGSIVSNLSVQSSYEHIFGAYRVLIENEDGHQQYFYCNALMETPSFE